MNQESSLACKASINLPGSFEELGIKKEVAAIFEAFGATPEKILRKVRDYSFNERLITFRYDKTAFLVLPSDFNPLCQYSTISTGLTGTPIVHLNFGDRMSEYASADSIRINLAEVATPYLSEYLREDAEKQRNRINEEWESVLIHTISHHNGICVKKYYLDHYEKLERIHVNAEIIEDALKEFFTHANGPYAPEMLRMQYEVARNENKKNLSDGLLKDEIERWTETAECNDVIYRSFYLE